MFKFHCPHCAQVIEAEDEWADQAASCPNCREEIIIVRDSLELAEPPAVPPAPARTPESHRKKQEGSRMKEYKVLSQKDKWFSGKFDPEVLEKAINAYAAQGWRVVAAASASFPAFIGGNRDEMVVIMERDK